MMMKNCMGEWQVLAHAKKIFGVRCFLTAAREETDLFRGKLFSL